jgi:glycosyltransferase involved in cell wall biosynthesis/GT2 family glycosyltransferase
MQQGEYKLAKEHYVTCLKEFPGDNQAIKGLKQIEEVLILPSDKNFNDKYIVIFHKDQPFSPLGIHSGAEMGTIHLARAMVRQGAKATVVGRITTGSTVHDGVQYIDLGRSYDINQGFSQINEPVDILISITRADVLESSLRYPNIKHRALWLQDSDLALTRLSLDRLEACTDVIIYASRALKVLLEGKGISGDKGEVIYNGFDNQIFYPREVEVEPHRIAYAGALVPEKGIQLLIEAFNIVSITIPGAELWLYGSEALWGYQQRMDKDRIVSLNPHIHFAGNVNQQQLAEAFSKSAITVIPSLPSKRFDPFPLTSIEAQACGCPVVVSTCGGLPEGLIEKETGCIFQGETPEGLAVSLTQALQDQETLRVMRGNARKHAAERFTWDEIGREFITKISRRETCPAKVKEDEEAGVMKNLTSKKILVLYQHLPEYDRKGGDFRTYRLLQALASAGHQVTLIGRDTQLTELETNRYRQAYEGMGIEVHNLEQVRRINGQMSRLPLTSLEELLKGRFYDAIWILWWNIAEQFATRLRALFPTTRIIVDSVDVAYLRLMRRAALYEDFDLWLQAAAMRRKEQLVYSAADVTLTVTNDDREVLIHDIPEIRTAVVPNVHEVAVNRAGFKDRKDLLFVGYFEHLPNTDAALYFTKEIFPLIIKKIPSMKLYLVGNAPPKDIRALQNDSVIVTGYAPDLRPYWQSARVSIAPLRYGAGMKGKIGQAMAEGLPVVTTTIGVEGMDLIVGEHILVADAPEEFAAEVLRLYEDQPLWEKVSANGYHYVNDHWSDVTVMNQLLEAFFLPLEYLDYIPGESKVNEEAQKLSMVCQAYDWWQMGFIASSEAAFREIIQRFHNYPHGYVGMAFLEYSRNNWKESMQWCQKANDLLANNPGICGLYGYLLKENGEIKKAESWLNKSFEAYPYGNITLRGLTELSSSQGRLSEALEYSRSWLHNHPHDHNALFTSSKILLDLGKPKMAWPLLTSAYWESKKQDVPLVAIEAQSLLVNLANELAESDYEEQSEPIKAEVQPVLPKSSVDVTPIILRKAGPRDWEVDLVIPVYGRIDLLERCLASLLDTCKDAHIIVVDDATPGSGVEQCIQQFPDTDQITLARLNMNHGFIGATRAGADLGVAPYILFLNSDILAFEQGWLTKMIPQEESVAVVGAKLLYPPQATFPLAGSIQHAGIARKPDGIPYHPFRGWPNDTPQTCEKKDVNAVTGGCMLVRRQIWEQLGGWDDRFGRGVYEDVDFCWRVKEKGYRILYQPDVCLYHFESASIEPNGHHLLYKSKLENQKKLLEKWASLPSDEALFFGNKTCIRWSFARKQITSAQAALERNNYQAAIFASDKALDRADDLPEALLFRARLYSECGEHERSANLMKKAISVNPLDWQVRLRLADEWIKAGFTENAADQFRVLKRIFPDDPAIRERENYLRSLDNRETEPNDYQKKDSTVAEGTNPGEILEKILDAADLPTALQKYEDQFSTSLFELVRTNADHARSDGDEDLANGLEDLAEYIKQVLVYQENAVR